MSEDIFYKHFKGKKGIDTNNINGFENKNNAILPESYKKFLLKNNGGNFLDEDFVKNPIIDDKEDFGFELDFFYYLENIKYDNVILDKFGLLLIISTLDPEFEIYLGVKEFNLGKIYLYDRDLIAIDFYTNDNIQKYSLENNEYPDEKDDYYFIFLANDFQDFIDAFIEKDL